MQRGLEVEPKGPTLPQRWSIGEGEQDASSQAAVGRAEETVFSRPLTSVLLSFGNSS